MAATSSNELHAKMDALHQLIHDTTLNSPPEVFEKYGSFWTPDAKAYMRGMGQPPSVGREQIVKEYRELFTYWSLDERRVLSRAASEDGTTVVAEMDNVLTIAGEKVEHFFETEVVTFKGDLIQEYHLYCDPSPILEIFTKKQAAAQAGAQQQ